MIDLPTRSGATPEVIGPAPHAQTSQTAPIMVQEELWQRMRGLPYVYVAPTLVSVSHARSLFLADGIGHGVPDAFQKGREFAHLHPHHDGSLHLTLPDDLQDRVEASGWGQRHPSPQHKAILIYGPRDRTELEIVWRLVQLSYSYALGELG